MNTFWYEYILVYLKKKKKMMSGGKRYTLIQYNEITYHKFYNNSTNDILKIKTNFIIIFIVNYTLLFVIFTVQLSQHGSCLLFIILSSN